jgi:hypothetical protein
MISSCINQLYSLQAVFRFRFRKFLGHPDPFRIRILLSSNNNNKKNLDSVLFVTIKNDANVPTKSDKQNKLGKKYNFCCLKVTNLKSRIWIRIRICKSADPDPFQNITDPEH